MPETNKKVLVLPEYLPNLKMGGPFAVVSEMRKANSDIFSFIEPPVNGLPKKKQSGLISRIRRLKSGYVELFNQFWYYQKVKRKIPEYCQEHDYIISHVIWHSLAIKKLFPQKKVLTVYHGQGSLYYELTELYGAKKNYFLKKYLEHSLKKCFMVSDFVGFPSRGALQALLHTQPDLERMFYKYKPHFFYNGIDIQNISNSTRLQKGPGDLIKIISVGNLSHAKGIDQIPKLLNILRNSGLNFSWTVIGNGVLEKKMQEEIDKYGLSSKINWVKSKVARDDVIKMLGESDLYLMLHRYSIFDLVTLEAMACGCIPILSDVGGNKEVILHDNGFLVDPNDTESLLNYLNNIDWVELSKRNREVVNNNFTNVKMIERYESFVKTHF